jgi:anti-sigma B factor antagonist
MPVPETGALPGSREGGETLRITTERAEGTSVLYLRGELDLRTVPKLRMRLAEALERGSGPVVVDLTDVTFIDSTGLSALLNALRRLTRAGRRMLLSTQEGPVLRLLRMTRLDSTFALYDSPEAALDAVTGERAAAA